MDQHTVSVSFDDSVTSIDDISKALSSAGYPAKSRKQVQN